MSISRTLRTHLGLEVAMNDAARVQIHQRVENVPDQLPTVRSGTYMKHQSSSYQPDRTRKKHCNDLSPETVPVVFVRNSAQMRSQSRARTIYVV